MDFYGLVLDENEKPVEGAEAWLRWTDISLRGHSEVRLKTDANGRFSLQGKRGKVVVIDVSKEGFYTARRRNQRAFEYANPEEPHYHEPEPDRPVVFHLRKKGNPEVMVYHQLRLHLSNGGSPTKLNLQTGRAPVSGDQSGTLSLYVWQSGEYAPESNRSDWRMQIGISDGGLTEYSDEFPFKAPADGYSSDLTFEYKATEVQKWSWQLNKTFYVCYGSPRRYGRLRVVRTSGNESCRIEYWMNPSGSRNVEFDNRKMKRPPGMY